MINLSQRARDLGYYSYLDQVRLLWDPDIFLCTDVQDFLSHRSRIEIPWYKKGSFERIYVILHNARIKRIKEDKKYFVIEDPTEAFVAFWHSQDWLPSPHSYESIIEANGLSEEDVLHERFFRY